MPDLRMLQKSKDNFSTVQVHSVLQRNCMHQNDIGLKAAQLCGNNVTELNSLEGKTHTDEQNDNRVVSNL